MKTKYTYTKVGLFIGLLSFYTLSSCIHTRQELDGIQPVARWWNNLSPVTKGMIIVMPSVSTCFLALKYYGGHQPNALTADLNNRHTTTPLPFTATDVDSTTMLNTTMLSQLQTFITKALENGEAKWSTSSSTTEIPSSTTTEAPLTIEDPMDLDAGEVMTDINNSGFSTERINYWLTKGLHIDAKNGLGYTLLALAISYNNEDAFQFLIDHGANLHTRDNNGQTTIMQAIQVQNLPMIKVLIEHHVDLCIKTKNGYTARYFAEKITDAENRSSIIAILDEAMKEKHCL